jgi:hypothetical protein
MKRKKYIILSLVVLGGAYFSFNKWIAPTENKDSNAILLDENTRDPYANNTDAAEVLEDTAYLQKSAPGAPSLESYLKEAREDVSIETSAKDLAPREIEKNLSEDELEELAKTKKLEEESEFVSF